MAKPQIEALLKTGRSYYYTGGGEGFLIIRTRQRFLSVMQSFSHHSCLKEMKCATSPVRNQIILSGRNWSLHNRTCFIWHFRGLDLSRLKYLNSYQMVHLTFHLVLSWNWYFYSFVNSLNNLRTPLPWNLLDIHGAQRMNLKILGSYLLLKVQQVYFVQFLTKKLYI